MVYDGKLLVNRNRFLTKQVAVNKVVSNNY